MGMGRATQGSLTTEAFCSKQSARWRSLSSVLMNSASVAAMAQSRRVEILRLERVSAGRTTFCEAQTSHETLIAELAPGHPGSCFAIVTRPTSSSCCAVGLIWWCSRTLASSESPCGRTNR